MRENPVDGASRGLNAARVAGFKDLHSYGRMRTNGLALRVLEWRYLQMTLNCEEKPNLMLHLYMKTLLLI